MQLLLREQVNSEEAQWLAKQIGSRLPPGWGATWTERGCGELTGTRDDQRQLVVSYLGAMEVGCVGCQAPDMGMLSNALALMLAGMSCVAYFVHVAGKANPADLPSRAPFVVNSHGTLALDLRAVADPDPDQQRRDVVAAEFLNESFTHCELLLPTVQQCLVPRHRSFKQFPRNRRPCSQVA